MSSEPNEKLFEKPPETITINEVAFMYQILQACAQRGAFKPDEFKDVGSLNEKLKAIIDYANFLEEQKNEETNEESTDNSPDKLSNDLNNNLQISEPSSESEPVIKKTKKKKNSK